MAVRITQNISPDQWNFIQVSCGRDHTLALTEQGKVLGWGATGSGRLPSSLPQYCTSVATRTKAVQINSNQNMQAIAAGYSVSLGITEQSTVQIWGATNAGIGGQINAINPVIPQQITDSSTELVNIKSISANEFQFGAVNQDGTLFTWGMNVEGALGRPATQFNDKPKSVENIPPVAQLAIGRGYMLAITDNGQIMSWGSNGAGQLGLGHLSSIATPQIIPTAEQRFKNIAAGTSHSLALTDQGQVLAWGSNHHGQLGREGMSYSTQPIVVPLPEPITAIATGMHFSFAVGESKKVYAWGWNGHGQLGVGDTLDRHAPTQLKYIKDATAIAAGETHAVALTSTGLFGWGSNAKSQLGELERQQKFAAQFF